MAAVVVGRVATAPAAVVAPAVAAVARAAVVDPAVAVAAVARAAVVDPAVAAALVVAAPAVVVLAAVAPVAAVPVAAHPVPALAAQEPVVAAVQAPPRPALVRPALVLVVQARLALRAEVLVRRAQVVAESVAVWPQVAWSPLHRICKAESAWGSRLAPDPAAQPPPTARQHLGQRTEGTEPPVAFPPVAITAQAVRKTGLAHTRCAQSNSGATSTRAAPIVSQLRTLSSYHSTSANDEEYAKPADLPVEQPTKYELVIKSPDGEDTGNRCPGMLAQSRDLIE